MAAIHEFRRASCGLAYARRELSPLEVARAALSRIEDLGAENQRHVSRRRRGCARAGAGFGSPLARRRALVALDGVPSRSKRTSITRGDPAPIGTCANDDAPPQPADAPAAARSREAGCVILARPPCPTTACCPRVVEPARLDAHPWRLDRNPSGSSSGAAAAAAAVMRPPYRYGYRGSVRLPATHCGIFALKPSLGRVPVYPPYMGRVAGPMTRTVSDAALFMNVLSRPDPRDFMSLPENNFDFSSGLDEIKINRLKIGFLPDMNAGLPVHPEVRAAAQAAAKALAKAGAAVEEMRSFLTPEMLDGMAQFFEARSYNDFMQMPAARQRKVLPFIASGAPGAPRASAAGTSCGPTRW